MGTNEVDKHNDYEEERYIFHIISFISQIHSDKNIAIMGTNQIVHFIDE